MAGLSYKHRMGDLSCAAIPIQMTAVSVNHGFSDGWVVKLTATGASQWQKCYGGSMHDNALDITETSDGGYVFAGVTSLDDGDVSTPLGQSDAWVVKMDGGGNLQWEKTLGGSLDEQASSIIQTPDGGFVVAGYTYSWDGDVTGHHGNVDGWLVKLNQNGDVVWQNAMGASQRKCSSMWNLRQMAAR